MNVLKRIFDVIPTPVKAAAVAAVIATAQLLSPESAEARSVPSSWTPVEVARWQNRLHENTFADRNNNFTTAEQVALAFKNNMMRGEDVRIETRLDVLLTRCGIITGKAIITDVERNDGNFANSWVNSDGTAGPVVIRIPNTPPRTQLRLFDIISENGTVRKVDQGTREL